MPGQAGHDVMAGRDNVVMAGRDNVVMAGLTGHPYNASSTGST